MAFFSPKVFSHPSWGRKASACRGCVHVWPLRERKEAPRAEKWTGVLLQRAPKRRLGVGPAAESPKAVSQSAECGGGKSRPPNRERGCARNFIPAFFLFFFHAPLSKIEGRFPQSSSPRGGLLSWMTHYLDSSAFFLAGNQRGRREGP